MAAINLVVFQILLLATFSCTQNNLTPQLDFLYEDTDTNTNLVNSISRSSQINETSDVSGVSCGPDQMCVPIYLCSNEQLITYGNRTLIQVRFSKANEENSPCPLLSTCCYTDDITIEPIMQPKEIAPGCGYRNKDGVGLRIENPDKEAQFGEFPWMLAVLRGRHDYDPVRNKYQCGGSLIHRKVVLTAAHCVYNHIPSAFRVTAGAWETKSKRGILTEQNRDVIHMVIHPQYNDDSLINDVALLFLNSSFDLAPHINTVCLPPAGYNFDFSKCVASGWGKEKYENRPFENILKKIELPVVPNYVCRDNLRKTHLGAYFQLHKSFLCAGGEVGIDTCVGDGGSPLACPIDNEEDRFFIAGIVAWGIRCGQKDIPGVYVNVSQFRKWIDDELASRRLAAVDYKPR